MPYALKIRRLRFASGSTMSAPSTEFDTQTVVVFVGPNNSGKSLILREIEDWCSGNDSARKILNVAHVDFPKTMADARPLLDKFITEPPENQASSPGHVWIGQYRFKQNEPHVQFQLHIPGFENAVRASNEAQLRSTFLKLYTVRLDGRTRFALADPKPTGDLLTHPKNHLWALFCDDDSRERVRKLTEEAFNLHFVIDPLAMTLFRIRMSDRRPATKSQEQALDATSREFHKCATLISELSDGVQAYTGLVAAVMSLPHRILLIDEPEAFLHPPLAKRLGRDLADLATERDASLFVATHSADFLMGCLEANPNVVIVRLTYENKVATSRYLPSQDLRQLMLDPLLRSTGALRGLFHRSVVIAESDSDRAFYDEVNRRLTEIGRGVDDTLFLNAQNWQTIPRIAGPLRRVGIPAAAIMDFDVITNNQNWSDIFDMLNLSPVDRTELETQRATCKRYLDAISDQPGKKKLFKTLGMYALIGIERDETEKLLDRLGSFGVFIVPIGELECWLRSHSIQGGRKNEWLVNAFRAMGSDPTDSQYLKPENDDVWSFIDRISRWTNDPARKGIP